MNRKYLLIGGLAILAVLAIIWVIPQTKKKKTGTDTTTDQSTNTTRPSGGSFFSSVYPDAPNPADEDSALETEAERLWPHLAKKQDFEKQREKAREEWQAFAAKYPKNFYIPADLKAPLTEQEITERRKELDLVAGMDTKFAIMEINARTADPGVNPKTPSKPDVTPEEQRAYFSYKIKELESRIQLIEYSIESSGLDAQKTAIAKKDLTVWKKELAELQEISTQVPKT